MIWNAIFTLLVDKGRYVLVFLALIAGTLILAGITGSLSDPVGRPTSQPTTLTRGPGPDWPMPSDSDRAAFRDRRDRFFRAVRIIESEDGKSPLGDGGKSAGLYHISEQFFDGAGGPEMGWTWPADVFDRDKAEWLMTSYFHRHEPLAAIDERYDVWSKLHHRGPEWRVRDAGDYAERVANLMKVRP